MNELIGLARVLFGDGKEILLNWISPGRHSSCGMMGTHQTLLHLIRRGATSVLFKAAPYFLQLVGLPGQDITLQLYQFQNLMLN